MKDIKLYKNKGGSLRFEKGAMARAFQWFSQGGKPLIMNLLSAAYSSCLKKVLSLSKVNWHFKENMAAFTERLCVEVREMSNRKLGT